MLQFHLQRWHLPRSSTASLARSLSGLANRAFNVTALSVGTIEYVTLGYPPRCNVQQLTKELRWSGNPNADSTMEDISLPDPPQAETSLEDSAVEQNLPPQKPPDTTYHLVKEGTIQGKTKLVATMGYTYNTRKKEPNRTIESQCTKRQKDHGFKASVIQQDGTFFPGMHDHNHPGEFGVLASTHIQTCVKQVNNHYMF